MRLSSIVFAICVALVAANNAVDIYDEEVSAELAENVNEELMQDEERDLSMQRKKKFRKNRKHRKHKIRNKYKYMNRPNKKYDKDHYYYDKKYDKSSYSKSSYSKSSYSKSSSYKKKYQKGECVLTACIETYVSRYNPDMYHPYFKNGHRDLEFKNYIKPYDGKQKSEGTVTLAFEKYDDKHEYTSKSQYDWHGWHGYEDKYYYAPDFDLKYNFDDFPEDNEGLISVNDQHHCKYISHGNPFWNIFKLKSNPWKDIDYGTDGEGKDKGKYEINDGYDCYAHVGKAVFVEMKKSDKYGEYYGCGILKMGDKKCH